MDWEKLCKSKIQGSICFKNLKIFNMALLAKQDWRLLKNTNSLLYKFIKAKHFPKFDFLETKLRHIPSYTWKSI